MPTAFVTGIGGQDGAYLAHFLLGKNYRVVGGARDVADAIEYSNMRALQIHERVEIVPCDLTDSASIQSALESCAPDEIYNLAAQSSVALSWQKPVETGEVCGLGAVRLFQIAREVCPQSRIFHASSSEIFGSSTTEIVDENTPLAPQNPYGAAKSYAHSVAKNLRENCDVPISCGILFNHESPLRPDNFVTRKITQGVARIKCGLQNELVLGNLEVVRDWGFAGDFVAAMWLCLQNAPDDFVIASGNIRPLRDFVDAAFGVVGLDFQNYVKMDATLFRPNEAPPMRADTTKSSTRLGWKTPVSFEQLVRLMVEADICRAMGKPHDVGYFAD